MSSASNMSVVQPLNDHSYIVRGVSVSLASIDATLEGLYLEAMFNPTMLMLSPADADALVNEIRSVSARSVRDVPTDMFCAPPWLSGYVNPTTGTYMQCRIDRQLPQGTLKLWSEPTKGIHL